VADVAKSQVIVPHAASYASPAAATATASLASALQAHDPQTSPHIGAPQ